MFAYRAGSRTISENTTYATIGGVVGTAQTIILREKVDPMYVNDFITGKTSTPPPGMKQLKQWAAPSVLTGLIGGGIATGLGIEGMTRGRILKSEKASSFALGYGGSALLGGVLNGIFPSAAIQNAVAKDPSNPLTTRVNIKPRSAANNQRLAASLIT